jgi:ABC-type Fe3+ transport system substrate-binding protein
MLIFRFIGFFLLISLGFLFSCGIEPAHEFKKQRLIIASDFIKAEDKSLFATFEKEHSIEIVVHYMSSDSISKRMRKEGYSTDIDLVILKSSLDICQLKEEGRLQKILLPENQPKSSSRFNSKEMDWFGIAVDPYIIVHRNDSAGKISTYSDLSKKASWMTNLKEDKELYPLIGGVLNRLRSEADSTQSKWFNGLFSKKTKFQITKDSSLHLTPILTLYSSFYSDSSLYKSKYKKGKVTYPNQSKGGTFYSLRSVGIVKQARNYTNACIFIQYITEDDVNQRLNNWWNTFPITQSMNRSYTYQNIRFKRYPVAMYKLCSERKKSKLILDKWGNKVI